MPRAPPRYRAQQDLAATTAAPRSPLLHPSEQPSSPKLLGQPKPEPRQRRRNPYENEYKDWKNQVQQDGGPEQATIPAKAVVEYKADDVSVGQKLYKGAVPYANPQEIQKRQKEMQERKMVEERREQENMERERIRREEEERQERDRQEHERIKREELARREERERIQHEELEQQERRDRERIDREQQERRERERIDREQQERRERERIDQERREREKVDREQQERRERERIDQERRERERIDREQQERREREKIDRERERIDREQQERRERERNDELERKKREEWEKKDRERIQREEMERKQREQLDDLSREEREFEMKLEQKRREKEKRLQELRRQLEEEEAEAERIEREYRERMNKKRDERMDQQRNPVAKETPRPPVAKEPPRPPVAKEPPRPPVAKEPPRPPAVQNTQVHYINDQEKGREMEETKARTEENRPARRVEYEKRQQSPNDSMDIDPVEVERQFQQRLAQETRNDEPDGGFITVIRVPVQQENWDQQDGEYMENTRKRMERVEIEGANEDTRTRPETDLEDRPRTRVDWQRSEDERYRKEMQRREQDAQLMRDFQKQRTFEGEGYRKPPVGAGVEQPVYPRPPEWEKEDELRRQREEDDRLREARANQLRNRCIEQPEEDENNRNASYTNGRTKRVKFATVRTEITQPSPDTELSKAGVKFVHDGKVADSEDEEELRRPPPPEDEEEAPPHPPPPENNTDYYQRPPPPPKPQYLRDNKTNGAPPEYSSYRDNEQFNTSQPQSRMTEQEMRYATYPGRQPHNNNYPVPKPRVPRNLDASPDQAKLPFKDKMKVFNENTPPKKQTTSRWEREQNGDLNGDTL